LIALASITLLGQTRPEAPDAGGKAGPIVPPPGDYNIPQLVARSVEHILSIQEGAGKAEWPYEGVYRVRGEIPIGYRVGGTGICAMALLSAPGYADDDLRKNAVRRAALFAIASQAHPLMNPEYDGGYDVRGWGYTYALQFLIRLKAVEATPADLAPQVDQAIEFYIDAIERTEIPEAGGWSYSRRPGRDSVSPPSPFMTGPTLQALFEARRLGFDIDQAVIKRGLDALERARTPSGAVSYAGTDGKSARDAVPGATGRMLVAESTLYLAGRSSEANVRGAIDAFIVHWKWLDQRRAQHGTHAGPYGIAPYYFFYAHYHAAQAVELLPERERGEYRRRIRDLLLSVRLPDGTWNDRVFARSSNYGTAMSMMALLMPELAPPARWKPDA
jgi:hypothetical protein